MVALCCVTFHLGFSVQCLVQFHSVVSTRYIDEIHTSSPFTARSNGEPDLKLKELENFQKSSV